MSVVVDNWNESWATTTSATAGTATTIAQCSCLGVRVTFDQPVAARSSYGLQYGFGEGGFELLSALDCGSECDFQPAVFTGILDSDARTVQLNVTWVYSEALPRCATPGGTTQHAHHQRRALRSSGSPSGCPWCTTSRLFPCLSSSVVVA